MCMYITALYTSMFRIGHNCVCNCIQAEDHHIETAAGYSRVRGETAPHDGSTGP